MNEQAPPPPSPRPEGDVPLLVLGVVSNARLTTYQDAGVAGDFRGLEIVVETSEGIRVLVFDPLVLADIVDTASLTMPSFLPRSLRLRLAKESSKEDLA